MSEEYSSIQYNSGLMRFPLKRPPPTSGVNETDGLEGVGELVIMVPEPPGDDDDLGDADDLFFPLKDQTRICF